MKIYFDTLGCPKNMNDTEHACGLLEAAGNLLVESPQEADVVIVNTCGFINDAKRESIDRIFELTAIKKPNGIMVVTGCLSMRYGEDLFESMEEVDIFLGVNDYQHLPQILADYKKGHRKKYLNPQPDDFLSYNTRKLQPGFYSATLRIAEGCDNHCTYCVIPEIRGHFRSRARAEILEEALWLSQNGCKELMLIAQDVTLYGQDIYGTIKLPDLLRDLCKIDGIEWIRLMYCYEDRISPDLITVMAEEEKICKYIDLPIQHLSDPVLKAMKRRSTELSIVQTIENLRQKIPNIHIRTTLITGFPGETQEDHDILLEGVRRLKFERLGVFAYSQEENTPAGERQDQIPEQEKNDRLDQIMRAQLEVSLESNRKKIGTSLKVLVEVQEEDGSYYGRTEYDAPEIDNGVLFTSNVKLQPGDFAQVTITDAFDYDLVGTHHL
jgi:ribosomal protein S12 methylthiotransferase